MVHKLYRSRPWVRFYGMLKSSDMDVDALMDFELRVVIKAGAVAPTEAQARDNGQSYSVVPLDDSGTLKGSHVLSNVINGKKYWGRYRARDGYNGYSAWSNWTSVTAGDITGPTAPTVEVTHNYRESDDRDDGPGSAKLVI